MTLFVNYVIMAMGICVLVVAVTLIFLDKLKGEDLYFNMDMKEQQLKKVMEDADELIDELNYTSELVINDMEKKYGDIKLRCDEIAMEARKNAVEMKPMPRMKEPSYPFMDPEVKVVSPVKKPSKLVNEEESGEKKKLSTRQLAVLEMAARGMSVTEIAREMNMGQGEVSLILSLRNEE